MIGHGLHLGASIAAAERACHCAQVQALAVSPPDDPFKLDLPPLDAAVGGEIDGPTMEVLGGLYLIAQLEQTGMLRTAELLIENRFALDLTSSEAAERLDQLATDSRSWYPGAARDQLYARVFGIGTASSAMSNTGFSGLLLDLCSAITAYDEAARFGQPTAQRYRTMTAQAVRNLRANLSLRQHGNTITAARTIAGQVRAVFDLLSHPGIIALARGRTLWDVVRLAWGDDPPDVDRFVTTGQAGQQLIGWAGSAPGDTGEPTSGAVESAARWLMASGFDLEDAA